MLNYHYNMILMIACESSGCYSQAGGFSDSR
jgi:hypothetical protein